MSFKTPKGLATGLGSAGTGTHHWWQHRISSVMLIPLTILFLFPFADVLGEPIEEVYEVYSNPFNAVIALLFIATMFHHLMQGLQVVIEDYVHHKGVRTIMLMGNTAFCALFGLAGAFAVLKIAFTA